MARVDKKHRNSESRYSEEVSDFIDASTHALRNVMKEVRSIILTDKDITEHIKWNAPSFCADGEDRVTFNLSKKDVLLLVFHRGAKVKKTKDNEPVFKDPTGLLEWLSPDRAVIRLSDLDDVKKKKTKLKKVITQWIANTRS